MPERVGADLCPRRMAWFIPGWGRDLAPGGRLERALVAEASSLAEELVAEAFSLTPRECLSLQYELLTDYALLPCRLPDSALAGLVRAETQALHPRKRRDFYFLFLAEERLLALSQGDSLRALLLYIFTHELIHMVRFARFIAAFWMPMEVRWQEERKVHRLATQILQKVPWRELGEILSRYDKIYA